MKGKASFFERMNRSKTVLDVHLDPTIEMPDYEDYVDNGVLTRKSVAKVFDPRKEYASLNAKDFDLSNLIKLGAVSGLKECFIHPSKLVNAEGLDAGLASYVEFISKSNPELLK